MVQFDWERKLRGREYIFPLKYRESELYVDVSNYTYLDLCKSPIAGCCFVELGF